MLYIRRRLEFPKVHLFRPLTRHFRVLCSPPSSSDIGRADAKRREDKDTCDDAAGNNADLWPGVLLEAKAWSMLVFEAAAAALLVVLLAGGVEGSLVESAEVVSATVSVVNVEVGARVVAAALVAGSAEVSSSSRELVCFAGVVGAGRLDGASFVFTTRDFVGSADTVGASVRSGRSCFGVRVGVAVAELSSQELSSPKKHLTSLVASFHQDAWTPRTHVFRMRRNTSSSAPEGTRNTSITTMHYEYRSNVLKRVTD